MMFIITGARGAGKTTLCQRLVAALKRSGWQAAGVLSPARFEGGQKTGIEVEDVRSGERRLLAQRLLARRPTGETDQRESAGVRTKGWVFDPDCLRWGSTLLGASFPCDLLVVDELGPLELERNEGWTSGLTALDGGRYRLALVVIRPELLETARQRWGTAQVVEVHNVAEVPALAENIIQTRVV